MEGFHEIQGEREERQREKERKKARKELKISTCQTFKMFSDKTSLSSVYSNTGIFSGLYALNLSSNSRIDLAY